MTAESTEMRLTLADKVNRLFEAYRGRGESEQTVDDVAASASQLISRAVSAEQIRALRLGVESIPDPYVIDGLIRHFAVPPEYLTTNGPRAERVDMQLQLLIAAREAGVTRLALRGGSLDANVLRSVLDAIGPLPGTES